MSVGWPEGLYLALVAIELLLVGMLHGAPRSDKWNFHYHLYSNAVVLGLLYWGGLFA